MDDRFQEPREEVAQSSGAWQPLAALVWYGLLALMGVYAWKFGHLRFTLVAMALLGIYGLLLFTTKTLAGRKHTYAKFHPWLALCIGLAIGFTGDQWWFSNPTFETTLAEQNPFEIPLSMEGVEIGWSVERVAEHLGEPTSSERHHFGVFRELDGQTALYLVSSLVDQAESLTALKMTDPAKVFTDQVIKNAGISPSSFGRERKSWTRKLLLRVKKGRTCGIYLIDAPINIETRQNCLGLLSEERLKTRDLLLVSTLRDSPYSALFVENLELGRRCTYEKQNLDLIFQELAGEEEVVVMAGRHLSIGDKRWGRVGGRISDLNTPGRPLEESSVNLLENSYPKQYEKEWGKVMVRVAGDFDRISWLEVWGEARR